MYPLGYGNGYDLSSVLDTGLGVSTPEGEPLPGPADPRKEYVVARQLGWGDEPDRGYMAFEGAFGGPLAWHGVGEYQRMYATCTAANSSINALRAGVLTNGINLLPAVKPTGGVMKPGQKDGSALESDMAAEVAESNSRLLDAWETPADQVLWEFLESKYLGHVLGELVYGDVEGGPDAGMLAIKAVKAKDRNSYQFRVDRSNNVIGVRALAWDAAAESASMRLFEGDDLDRFAWMTNDPYRGDPRGRSCFRMAHYYFKLLMDLWPEVWKGWKQFGVPMMWGNTAEGIATQGMVPLRNRDGTPKAGPGVTPEFAMAMQIARMKAGDSAAGPFGSGIKVIESTKDSSVAQGGIDVLEGQIIRSILLQMRATMEAQHGSKADSQTGQDVLGTLVRYKRKTKERFLRRPLMLQNGWNYGPDIARRLTPLVDLGGTEHQDFPANSSGVATLFQSSYFTDSQLPYVDTFLGLPQRQPGEARVGPPPKAPATPDAGQAAPKSAPAGGGATGRQILSVADFRREMDAFKAEMEGLIAREGDAT